MLDKFRGNWLKTFLEKQKRHRVKRAKPIKFHDFGVFHTSFLHLIYSVLSFILSRYKGLTSVLVSSMQITDSARHGLSDQQC